MYSEKELFGFHEKKVRIKLQKEKRLREYAGHMALFKMNQI